LRLSVRSVPGRGSVFSVEVPLGSEPENTLDTGRQTVTPGSAAADCGAVLVVEDDETVLDATVCLLQIWGFRALPAPDAGKALELARNHGEQITFAVMDYQLPESWNGVELHRQLERTIGRKLNALLVTGDTSVQRLKEVAISGLGVLHKPIDTAELYRLINGVQKR